MGEEPFTMHILKTQPDMDRKAIRSKRNQYWNGLPRDDASAGRSDSTVSTFATSRWPSSAAGSRSSRKT